MAKDALNRWGCPSIAMHSTADELSVNSMPSMVWKIKLNSNDALRQKFIDQTVPHIKFLGLALLNKDLKWHEAHGHYGYGQIDWVNFFNVVKGQGPCNEEPLAAWNEGAWYGDALTSHADKQAA